MTDKNKEKTAENNCGFDEISKLLTRALYVNDKRLYKSFGVQSGVGGIGKRASLISWRLDQSHVGSISLTRIPHSAHLPKIKN